MTLMSLRRGIIQPRYILKHNKKDVPIQRLFMFPQKKTYISTDACSYLSLCRFQNYKTILGACRGRHRFFSMLRQGFRYRIARCTEDGAWVDLYGAPAPIPSPLALSFRQCICKLIVSSLLHLEMRIKYRRIELIGTPALYH